jgi:tetratricopeptide (TPR) repeat protein
VRPKAKEFALRAMEIDARLAEAHTSLAHVHATYEWDWQTAELEYLTAIRLNPSYATSHHWYAITLLAPLCRLSEALEEIRRARECDAISLSIRRDEALVQLYQNDAEAALASATQLMALDSRFAGAWWLMGLIAEHQGRYDAGIEAQRRAVELSGRQPRMLGALGHVLGRAGSESDASEILTELEHLLADRYVSPFDVALVHLGLNHTEAAFSHLSRALSLRSYELVTLQVDPRYAPLRPFRGYEELRRTLGF